MKKIKNKKLKIKNSAEGGFSLIEMVIAIGIFGVIIWSTVGIILRAVDAQAKASEIRTVQDNIRFALEYMTKEIRTGRNITTAPAFCSGGFCSRISFTNDRNQTIQYCAKNFPPSTTVILVRSLLGNCDNQPNDENFNIRLTSDDVNINSFLFVVNGNTPGSSDGQPVVTILMQVSSNPAKIKIQSRMNIQTSITQRLRDI